MKKYKLTDESMSWLGHTLYRIESLRDFADVKAGDKGGWVEREENLSHYGNAWVHGNAKVCENARVYENAWVYGDAEVYGNARVYGDAEVLWVSKIGSHCGTTTAFKCSDDTVKISCGCFWGTIEEFEKAVIKIPGDNKYGKEYKAVIELIKVHFDLI